MQRHLRSIMAASLAVALSSVAPVAWASHDPDISDDESKCQLGTSLAIGKFVTDKAKCIIKCEKGARKEPPLNSAGDCVSPFANATLACVQKAESKAEGLEQSKCAKDCPECYEGGDCAADADARVASAEAQVDGLALLVYCDDSGSGDGLTAEEAKCQDTVAKTLSNFAKKKLNCYAKCRKAEHKGLTPVGSCDPPTPTEAKAAACIDKEEGKAAFLIDKKCDSSVNPSADKPECYGLDGAGWAGLVETAIDGGQADLYCGSPSGAFLD